MPPAPFAAPGSVIRARDNVLFKRLRQIAGDGSAYRKHGQIWLEGEHLCRAALDSGLRPALAVLAQSLAEKGTPHWLRGARQTVVLHDGLFAALSPLPSPAALGCVMDWPGDCPEVAQALRPDVASVVLDRVQDAGNVGSILRSAAALGFGQIVALDGTAALWSQKVLRAGMGAHFSLHLVECAAVEMLDQLAVPLLAASAHAGRWLDETSTASALPWPCAWVFGHEGQGLAPAVQQRAVQQVRIRQAGGQESLNVAAAAAICLHASSATAFAGV